MSTFGKTERETLEAWYFMFPESRSGLIASQKDANLAPSRIGHLKGVRHELAKERGIRAILLQGFKLPKTWQREGDEMSSNVNFDDLSPEQKRAVQRETLRRVAQLAGGFVGFSDESEQTADAEAARRQAADYADSINKRRGSSGSGSSGEDASARTAAEKFAENWNRRHGRRDK
jgi:hypothetical protein